MEKSGGGSIILVASQLGRVARPGRPWYCGAKGGLINMTKHMAVYWAKDNIRVNCLSPGAFPKTSIKETFKKRLEEKIPLGKIGSPKELSGPLLLLASDAGSYITGHNLVVDGGLTKSY